MKLATLLIAFIGAFTGLATGTMGQSGAKGYIGLALTDAPSAIGAVVRTVTPGGPADGAGLRSGDIIVSINGAAVNNALALTRIVAGLAPNQTARLNVIRPIGASARRLTINVVIGATDGSPRNATNTASPTANSKSPSPAQNSPAPNNSAAAANSAAGTLKVSSYTKLTDPLEQAFTVEVPSGWKSAGGLARRAALQINPYVRSVSPDKMTYLMMGDPGLPSFSPPSQMGNVIGHREGTFYDAGLGGLALVMHYLPGAEFARAYGQTMLPGLCPGMKFSSSMNRPDLARAADAAAPTVIPSRTDGGEAIFTCVHNKQEMEVRVSAATRITRDNVIWSVILLGGYIAPKAQANDAEAILTHMAASLTFSPAWIQKQNNLSQQAAQEINRHMEEIFRQERSFIQNLNSVDENFESVDELISGFSTYHDDRTGTDYSLSNTNPNKWIDDSTGRIVSTPTNSPPPWGPAYRALPRGQ